MYINSFTVLYVRKKYSGCISQLSLFTEEFDFLFFWLLAVFGFSSVNWNLMFYFRLSSTTPQLPRNGHLPPVSFLFKGTLAKEISLKS